MAYADPLELGAIQRLQGNNTLAVGSGGTIGFDAGSTLDFSAATVLYSKPGILLLPLSSLRIITANNTDTKANAGGIPASNTNPSLQRSNGATDKSLVLSWAASNVQEVQFDTVPIPPDLNPAVAVTFKCQAIGAATDAPVIAVSAWEGTGDANRGGNLAAISAVLQTLTLAITLTAAPNFLAITLTPGAHGTDALNLYAAWIEYQRQ